MYILSNAVVLDNSLCESFKPTPKHMRRKCAHLHGTNKKKHTHTPRSIGYALPIASFLLFS